MLLRSDGHRFVKGRLRRLPRPSNGQGPLTFKEQSMNIYRSPMEKTLQELEDQTVISNPRDRIRTWMRKIAYRVAWWKDRFNRRTSGGSKQNPRA